jgi:hypothetical protein
LRTDDRWMILAKFRIFDSMSKVAPSLSGSFGESRREEKRSAVTDRH